MAETTTNTNEKLMGALAYLMLFVSGIFLLLIERKNQYIRFHAMQSILVFGGIFLLQIVLGIVPILGWLIALILSPLIFLTAFLLWLVLMFKAYSGEKYHLPFFGDLADKQLAKLK